MKEFTSFTTSGSVRVDLLGGTIDLEPINVALDNVVTLNLATSLKAKVTLSFLPTSEWNGIIIHSKDYNSTFNFKSQDFTRQNLKGEFFGPMNFICQILDLFKIHSGLKIELESGSPAGAGLGGSSSMGVTFYKALSQVTGHDFNRIDAIAKVRALEASIIWGPAGYQDYYPALFGGVLALVARPGGVDLEQLYSEELSQYLNKNLILFYSGETRLSGINNWEVYKAFFDKKSEVIQGLSAIRDLSHRAYHAIKEGSFDKLSELIALEGESREKLFPAILNQGMKDLKTRLPGIGLKVCGAGGGGCFLVIPKKVDQAAIEQVAGELGMKRLPFFIDSPL